MRAAVFFLAWLAGGQPAERVADIQIHGNTLTADARIRELAGIEVGSPVTPSLPDDVASRLRNARLFQHVEVLKRFASIADPSQVAIVIVVDEGPVRIVDPGGGGQVRVEKRRGPPLMFLPILSVEDGYGVSYGLQTSIPEPFGAGSRVSFPLTWGGERRAGVEMERPTTRGPLSRILAGGEVTRRTNPFFEEHDVRQRAWVRIERDLGRSLRVGATGAFERISFMGDHGRYVQTGVDAVLDTRVDPFLPRNAVYGRATWDRLRFDHTPDASRSELEARGYLGAIGQSVVVLRGLRQDSSEALPPPMRPLLGGAANLRGLRAGSALGDTLVAMSAEWRVPLTSPLSIGKIGVSAFVDMATVYDKGSHLRDHDFDRGAGVGVWLSAALLHANISIAHGVGGSTRAHVGLSATF